MPTITAQIEKVEHVASGVTSKGKQWHLFAVIAGGKRYTTFDGDEWQKKVGGEATFEFTETVTEKNGKKYTDLRIVPPKKQDVGDAVRPVMDKLASIEGKCDMILDVLKVRVP